jgi:hypothetical protein
LLSLRQPSLGIIMATTTIPAMAHGFIRRTIPVTTFAARWLFAETAPIVFRIITAGHAAIMAVSGIGDEPSFGSEVNLDFFETV